MNQLRGRWEQAAEEMSLLHLIPLPKQQLAQAGGGASNVAAGAAGVVEGDDREVSSAAVGVREETRAKLISEDSEILPAVVEVKRVSGLRQRRAEFGPVRQEQVRLGSGSGSDLGALAAQKG